MRIIKGIRIIIFNRPKRWSSGLNGECPNQLRYPVTGEVVEVDENRGDMNVKIKDTIYGFCMDTLIKDNFENVELITD